MYVAIVTAPSVAMKTSPLGRLLNIGHGAEIVIGLDVIGRLSYRVYEPRHDKTNSDCAPSEGSDQPGHPPV